MRNVILIFSALLICRIGFGQETKAHIEIGKHDQIVKQLFLPNKGFILVTGIPNQIGGKIVFDVRYFNIEGKQQWSKPVTLEYGVTKGITNIIITPDGETIYFIQMRDGGYYDKRHYISQFKINGDEKKFEFEGKEAFGKNLQTIFCDNNYLYYLATDDGNEFSNKKKGTEKLVLNRFDQKNLSNQRFLLNLPAFESSEHTTFWSLIGQKGDDKFLVSKSIDTDAGKNTFTVVTIDTQGKTGKTIALETSLSNGKFTRPSYVPVENTWEDPFVRVDFIYKENIKLSTDPNTNSPSIIRLTPTDGAFGHILYSDLHDSFYVYGLFGPKPFRNIGPVYEGFYVHKFDRNGVASWKLQEMANKELMDYPLFKVHATPIDRTLRLVPTLENNLIAAISVRDSSFPYIINSNGVATAQPKREDNSPLKIFYASEKKMKSLAYLEKVDAGKKVGFICFRNSANELLLKFDSKESTIDVLLFKD